MNAELRELHAFVDGELELQRELAFEDRMREDAALRAEVERLRELRRRLRTEASTHLAPARLQQRVRAALAAEAGRTATQTPARRPRRWSWPVIAPAFAMVLVLLVSVPWLLPPREDARIAHDVLASHARAVLAQHLVDVASSDHHTVKPWLSARLDFSPPVDPPALPATELLGARIDYVDGRPVATLVLRHAGHTVDDFVWPADRGDSAVRFGAERGFQLAHWTRNGMRHWVISDLNATEFATLVRALAAGP